MYPRCYVINLRKTTTKSQKIAGTKLGQTPN